MIHLLIVLMSLEQKIVSSVLAIMDTQGMVSPVQLLVSIFLYHISVCTIYMHYNHA